jgi:hypothetical protein
MTWSRVRMLITALLSLGTIASSCTPPSIESRLSGSLHLDPVHPRWTRVVVFTANDAALHGGGRIIVGLSFQSRWSEGDHNGPDVDGTLKRLGDLKADARAKFDSRGGCTGPDCLGRYRISFSWLPELKTGSVDISWSVAGIVEFVDVPVVDDAKISVSFV